MFAQKDLPFSYQQKASLIDQLQAKVDKINMGSSQMITKHMSKFYGTFSMLKILGWGGWGICIRRAIRTLAVTKTIPNF